jgi:hypothetical protein
MQSELKQNQKHSNEIKISLNIRKEDRSQEPYNKSKYDQATFNHLFLYKLNDIKEK